MALNQNSITLLSLYKQNLPSFWEDEMYKWEAVQHFQKKWDIEAEDFGAMIQDATAKHVNLLDVRHYFPIGVIREFARVDQKRTRNMFRTLFDESKDVAQRITKFMAEAEAMRKTHDFEWNNHYQDLHAISVYLTFRYPEKYYIYKSTEFKNTVEALGDKFPYKKTDKGLFYVMFVKYLKELNAYLKADKELQTMMYERLNKDNNLYTDVARHILTVDFVFYVGKRLKGNHNNIKNIQIDEQKTIIKQVKDVPRRYWWLTGSPKYWSPSSDWELGGDVDYTLYNEEGNKRRIFKHFMEAKPGDMVIAYESSPVLKIVAIGRVVSETDGEVLYIRKIEELIFPVPYSDILANPILKKSEPVMNRCQGSLFHLTQDEYTEIMRLIRKENPEPIRLEEEPTEAYPVYTDKDFLREVYVDESQLRILKSILKRKKNLILQGAPGVGKTYAAKRLAYAMIGEKDDERVKCIQFHQSYSYEDFVMGYKPNADGGFSLEKGIFYDICQEARLHHDKSYFLIIDEINRGNLSKIFGELLQLIEADYRDIPVMLAYNKQRFSVPSNLYIIGMMNTADRSLAMIDYALRRRFSFYEMTPAFGNAGFKGYIEEKHDSRLDSLVKALVDLNKVIVEDDSLGKGFCIGHSYLCNLTDDYDLQSIVEYDILPMLREYWFDNDVSFDKEAEKLREAVK